MTWCREERGGECEKEPHSLGRVLYQLIQCLDFSRQQARRKGHLLVLGRGWLVSVTHLLERTKLLEYNPCYQKEAKDVSLVVNIYVFRRPFATEGVQTNSFFPTMGLHSSQCAGALLGFGSGRTERR